MLSVKGLCFPRPSLLSPGLEKKISTSLDIFSQAFDKYPDSLGLSFNGGKDSTIILDLMDKTLKHSKIDVKIQNFYINTGDEFSEITDFIEEAKKNWNFDLFEVNSPDLKSGLKFIIEKCKTRGVFLGLRRSDGGCDDISYFEPTSKGWPEFTRILPVLDWTYKDVWEYISAFHVPVCKLYSEGYSSIGSKKSSRKNPLLLDSRTGRYLHARFLVDEREERNGRN